MPPLPYPHISRGAFARQRPIWRVLGALCDNASAGGVPLHPRRSCSGALSAHHGGKGYAPAEGHDEEAPYGERISGDSDRALVNFAVEAFRKKKQAPECA